MLLSEIVDNNDFIIGFLRFSSKERLEQLRSGSVYMNTFQFFKELEQRDGKKGQGDAHDLSLIINNLTRVQFVHPETGEVFLEGTAGKGDLFSPDDYKNHLYCLTAITPNMLEILSRDGNEVQVKLNLPDELKHLAAGMFGDHVMFISKPLFLERVYKECLEKGYQCIHGKVNYKDMSINYMERFVAFNEGKVELFFEKDKFYEFQNEYRIVILNAPKEGKALELEIGDISDISILTSLEVFNKNELRFGIRLQELEESSND